MSQTLPKAERLSGTASVSALFGHGKGFSHGSLRCKVLPRQDSVMPGPEPVMPGPDRASAQQPSAEENYFLEGFPKNQFPSASANPIQASALPAPEQNYFSEQCPKNQFSSGIASPSRADASRIVVSVPKRLFKRAVKRNLLKRRIREAYRRQKGLLSAPLDILFIYAAPEVLPYEAIFADMTALLTAVSEERRMQVVDNQADTQNACGENTQGILHK